MLLVVGATTGIGSASLVLRRSTTTATTSITSNTSAAETPMVRVCVFGRSSGVDISNDYGLATGRMAFSSRRNAKASRMILTMTEGLDNVEMPRVRGK